jgi:superfamily II DNA or RNA helicase
VLRCDSTYRAWKEANALESFTTPSIDSFRIVAATMDTAVSPGFRDRVVWGNHITLIADEVHQLGSERRRTLFECTFGNRLALSATPERYGDVEGTDAIFRFFGSVLAPELSLSDAQEAGRLVPYDYFPHFVHLTDAEIKQYSKLSEDISKAVARLPRDDGGSTVMSESVKRLFIRRARIGKKAAAKVGAAVDIVSSTIGARSHWLVYCEDNDQLDKVRERLTAQGIDALEYRSGMLGNPDETMRWFRDNGGVLLSMRCLDEGVDIPIVDNAVILASSQNPRQFIQRRGRVLRTADQKYSARIHDVLVVPPESGGDGGENDTVLPLLQAEIRRATEFAANARNKASAITLRRMALEYGLSAELDRELSQEEEGG